MALNKYFRKLFLTGISLTILIFTFTGCTEKTQTKIQEEKPKPNQFGLTVNNLIEVRDTIETNQTLTDILIPHGVTQQKINEIEKKSLNVFPLRSFRANDELYIYAQWDSVETVQYLVYKKDPVNYVVFDLRDAINIYKKQKPFSIKQATVNGNIKDNLIQTLLDKGVKKEVGFNVADIYESQIDFGTLRENDSFTIIYEEINVDNEPVQIGKILAAKFNYRKKDYYAFRFDKEREGQYFDEHGNGLQGMFLTAPIKFRYRITSRYSSNRFHPILHRNKAHLGTDYAAATGTPIMTVATGVVIEAGYTSGNGNYVKVKHNGTYTTQYLHMSRFAKGIRRGSHVIQGQTIGYVGMTGLATGPHVCFRFWKNGKQVNPLKEKNQSADPVSKKNKADFNEVGKTWMEKIAAVNEQPSNINDPKTESKN
ncbi:MAG: peptidoglycan DD-metalloendopeptidase family protein [Ignavibacteriales bacterium]|nr:peptidoglycan DD-metalloendopeptidase family protein [Ignavibacteriales bacterium]